MKTETRLTAEGIRLEEARGGKKWRRWGTYLSERQWGTVREDYSSGGDAWSYFTYEDACARAYRWGEDGLFGICDNRGLLHFAVALWNEKDPILKERLFGLTGPEGNHGEDVKEVYHYLDATPTHAYAKALYRYPHRRFPYEELRERARQSDRRDAEPELWDTGIFSGDAFFDVVVEYAKVDIEDMLVRVTVTNRGPEAPIHLVPTIWYRNTWAWTSAPVDGALWADDAAFAHAVVACNQSHLGPMWLHVEGKPELYFTDNETNDALLFKSKNRTPYTKDAFHAQVVRGETGRVNPERRGSKACAHQRAVLARGASHVMRLRLSKERLDHPFLVRLPEAHARAGATPPSRPARKSAPPSARGSISFDEAFARRVSEADAFYASIVPAELGQEEQRVYRQAMAGLLWTKQFYAFDVDRWLRGDSAFPAPPEGRRRGRNREWRHLYNSEVLSVPDKWEYPWYAAWDLAFHCVPFAIIDPDFAKSQLALLLREWYMHPNGQLPAYEWAFGDVNPPVHAWAALRVYQIERKQHRRVDRAFLESVFHKLMLNFTWWVNRKDAHGNNVFEGGFLGLDNIGVFDRSNSLPEGGMLEQADATSWMGMYCINLLTIALELASENDSYQDVANKFFEHFLYIARAMNGAEGGGACLWDEEDGFFYDVLSLPNGERVPLKVRSMVGLTPLFAVESVSAALLERFPAFVKRMRWFVTNRPELGVYVERLQSAWSGGSGETEGKYILSLLTRERLVRLLERVLDENEFLSPYGIRALSRAHKDRPYVVRLGGRLHRVEYEPAESASPIFGGNSNWRGPVWFPVNFLIIEALQKYHHFYGDDLLVECPTGSGRKMNLWEVASELSRRLVSLFLRGPDGARPADGDFVADGPEDPVTFYEYFHGDTGAGLGASHQTGWTALVAKLLHQSPLWAGVPNRKSGDV